MISPDLNFLEFLKKLEGMDRAEIIRVASRERRAAIEIKERGDKNLTRKIQEYQSDIGDFLHFVHYGENAGMSWPDAYLASSEWRNKQSARSLDFP